MPSSSVFQILSANPIGLATLRLLFSKAPKAIDATALNDALNFNNYVITGADSISVFDVLPVNGNPLAIDLLLSNTLIVGNWTISASNIVTVNTLETVYTGTVNFTVTQTYVQDAVAPGSKNDSAYAVLRKFFHPALKGHGWDSILSALATGDDNNWTNSQLAFKQLFLSTARGEYLNKRAAENGQTNPQNVGLTDELFRKLAITTKTRALSQEAILEVLEVFYGIDATRASIISTVAEPFILKDGDELDISIDEKSTVRVPFIRNHFANIALATAEEVASEITRTFSLLELDAYAINNAGAVQIYSGSRGLTSSVRIIGGRAQIALQFPTVLFNTSFTNVTWNVALSPVTTGNLRFSITAGTYFNLSNVQTGDYVYIYGNEFSGTNSIGSFKIQSVNYFYSGATLIQYFEITNPSGVAVSSIVQTSLLDLNFFRPTRYTIYNDPRHVIVGQNGDNWLDVIIPATTQAVNRFPGIAAYLNQTPPLTISSLTRDATGLVTVNTSTNHGLVSGNQIIVSNVFPSGTPSPVTAGTASVAFSSNIASGTTNASIQSTSSNSGTVAVYNHQVVRLPAGQLMVVGGQTQTDATHVTPLTHPIIFEVTGSTILANGGRQDSYTWKNLVTDTYTIANRAFGVCVLPDGTVLATGGTTGDDITGTATNAWDLISFSDSATSLSSGTLPAALATHTQCSRSNGDAFVAGGWITAGTALTTVYKFNGSTHVWSALTSMNFARMYANSIEIPNNSNLVLVAGGLTTVPTNTCELYNTTGNTWSLTGKMTYARYQSAMVALPDGRILVVGGNGFNPTQSSTSVPLNSCEVFDPTTNLWSPIGSMSVPRINPSVFYIPYLNQVYVIGGGTPVFGTPIIEILDLKTMKWRQSIAPTSAGLTGAVAGFAKNDTIAVIGGLSGTATVTTNFVIVPGSESQYSGGLNRVATVLTTPLANQLTYQTNDFVKYERYMSNVSGIIIPIKASPAPKGIPGPFSYDVKNGLSVSPSTATGTVNQILNANSQYSFINLDTSIDFTPALAFPDTEGYIVINYGYANQVGPIKYLGRFSETAIRIDPGFKFPQTQAVGSVIYWLSGRSPFIPPANKLTGSAFITGSAIGRIAAEDNVNKIIAAGKDVKITVKYPGDVGLGHEGFPTTGSRVLSDIIIAFGSDNISEDIAEAQAAPA